jgi:hypothetical protein
MESQELMMQMLAVPRGTELEEQDKQGRRCLQRS